MVDVILQALHLESYDADLKTRLVEIWKLPEARGPSSRLAGFLAGFFANLPRTTGSWSSENQIVLVLSLFLRSLSVTFWAKRDDLLLIEVPLWLLTNFRSTTAKGQISPT